MEEFKQAEAFLQNTGVLSLITDTHVEDREAEEKFCHHGSASALEALKESVERIKTHNMHDNMKISKHIALAFRYLQLKSGSDFFLQARPTNLSRGKQQAHAARHTPTGGLSSAAAFFSPNPLRPTIRPIATTAITVSNTPVHIVNSAGQPATAPQPRKPKPAQPADKRQLKLIATGPNRLFGMQAPYSTLAQVQQQCKDDGHVGRMTTQVGTVVYEACPACFQKASELKDGHGQADSPRWGLGAGGDIIGRRQTRSSTGTMQRATATKEVVHLLSDDEDDPPSVSPPSSRQRTTRGSKHATTAARFEGLQVTYPPNGGRQSVAVTSTDLEHLDPEHFLNDTLIDFYMRYLWDHIDQDAQARCHFFGVFMFKMLTSGGNGGISFARGSVNHAAVKRWTKDVDIFSKQFLFIPIHEGLHWSLAIVCFPSHQLDAQPQQIPCILHLDSLASCHETNTIGAKLLDYLWHEWDLKSKTNPDSVPGRWAAAHPGVDRDFSTRTLAVNKVSNLPKQTNMCDCGLFVLAYVEFFCACLPEAISLSPKAKRPQVNLRALADSMHGRFAHALTSNWFDPSNASTLRDHLRTMILEQFCTAAGDSADPSLLQEAQQEVAQYYTSTTRYYTPAEWPARALELQAQQEAAKAERASRRNRAAKPGHKAVIAALRNDVGEVEVDLTRVSPKNKRRRRASARDGAAPATPLEADVGGAAVRRGGMHDAGVGDHEGAAAGSGDDVAAAGVMATKAASFYGFAAEVPPRKACSGSDSPQAALSFEGLGFDNDEDDDVEDDAATFRKKDRKKVYAGPPKPKRAALEPTGTPRDWDVLRESDLQPQPKLMTAITPEALAVNMATDQSALASPTAALGVG